MAIMLSKTDKHFLKKTGRTALVRPVSLSKKYFRQAAQDSKLL